MSNFKNGGYEKKYIISKSNGNPTDPNADYFVLRLDADPHARKALMVYAESVSTDNKELSDDLKDKLQREYNFTQQIQGVDLREELIKYEEYVYGTFMDDPKPVKEDMLKSIDKYLTDRKEAMK